MGDEGVVESSKRQKRLERIRQNPTNVSFEDLRRLLLDYGFSLERSSGSHHIFKIELKGILSTLIIPFARPVKPVYVKQALLLIEEAEQQESETEDDNSTDD